MSEPKAQYDLATIGEWVGFFKTIFDLHDRKVQSCLPAIVEEYDRKIHMATVKPLASYVYTDGNEEFDAERPSYKVRVMQFFHGGFLVDAPVYKNDTGILIAGDRNAKTAIDGNSNAILQDLEYGKSENKGPAAADFSTILSFENGFFIPCSFTAFDADDGDNLVIMKRDSIGRFVTMKVGIDGISIKRSIGDDNSTTESYRIDDDGIKFDGKEDRTVELLHDIRYDVASHQLQKRTITQKVRGDFVVGVSGPSGWSMITGGQAVPESE